MEKSEISFSVQDKSLKDIWMVKLTEEGIKFNREDFPELTADEFAKEFIHILECQFNVRFEKKTGE